MLLWQFKKLNMILEKFIAQNKDLPRKRKHFLSK
jgi:hypothetical protein